MSESEWLESAEACLESGGLAVYRARRREGTMNKKYAISTNEIGRWRSYIAVCLRKSGLSFTAIGQVMKVSTNEARNIHARKRRQNQKAYDDA